KYPRTPEELDQKTGELFGQLAKESDRGVALIGAALLDAALESMLRRYFVDDAKTVEELLLNEGGPLSSFSARIKVAYCLGLFARNIFRDLDTVRGIRNEFAHHI